MNHFQRSLLGTLLILVITLCAGFLVNRWTARLGRIDTTDQQLYTLTDGTRNILDGLQTKLTAKLFYSKTMVDETGVDQYRQLNNFFYYVRDLLRTYERRSGGKLDLQVYDPVAFSDAEGEADRLGVRRFPTPSESGFYFGLGVVSEEGEEEVIEFLDPQRQSQIEYLVSEAIERATQPDRSRIGVLASVDVTGGNMSPMERQMRQMQGQPTPQPWQSIELLRRLYEVEDVAADATEIDPTLDYLLIIHPKDLSDETLYAVDQFVMRGGKLMCFVDPFAPIADPAPNDQQSMFGGGSDHDDSSELPRLLENWGVTMESQRFVGDFALGLQVNSRRGPQTMGAVLGLNTKGEAGEPRGVNRAEPITEGISSAIRVYFPGVLETNPDAPSEVDVTPLLTSTEAGRTFTAPRSQLAPPMGGPDPQAINQMIEQGEPAGRVTIAARISGTLRSAFPDGAPDSPEAAEADAGEDDAGEDDAGEDDAGADDDAGGDAAGEDGAAEDGDGEAEPTGPAHLAETAEPTQLVVCADVDMLTDPLALQRSMFGSSPGGGCEFLLNAVDALAGSTDLMQIRSRGNFERPFTVVEAIERRADERLRQEVAKLNQEIESFDSQISELRAQANEDNVALLQGDAIEKKRELERKKRAAQRQLNEVQRARNEEIDDLESNLLFLNVVGVPGAVLVIGLLLWATRLFRRMSVTGGAR